MAKSSLKTKGIPSPEDMENSQCIPSSERIVRGPVAVIECFEEIPCDPCETCCPKGAITIGKPITNLPKLDADKCNGCGNCVSACPGLAIFVVDGSYSESEGLVTIPYEFLPIPEPGQIVEITDRSGQPVGKGKIVKVKTLKQYDCTAVVTVTVPKPLLMEVRGINL